MSVPEKGSRKDLISVDSCLPESSEMTTFKKSRTSSIKALVATLLLSFALCIGLIIALIVVCTHRSTVSNPEPDQGKLNQEDKQGDLCLSEGCIGNQSQTIENMINIRNRTNKIKIKILK